MINTGRLKDIAEMAHRMTEWEAIAIKNNYWTDELHEQKRQEIMRGLNLSDWKPKEK